MPRIVSRCLSFNSSVMADEMNPGATVFTVMLREATSCASDLDMPIRPAFEAA